MHKKSPAVKNVGRFKFLFFIVNCLKNDMNERLRVCFFWFFVLRVLFLPVFFMLSVTATAAITAIATAVTGMFALLFSDNGNNRNAYDYCRTAYYQ